MEEKDIKLLQEQLSRVKKHETKLDNYFNKLSDLILGPNYYNCMCDCDSCENEVMKDCEYILTDPFVRFFIKRAVKRCYGFNFNPHKLR